MNKEPCKVLIVDDEPWNLEVLEAFFEGTGYKIIRASNGEEALSVMEEPVDLVLLDVMMPGIDGYEVCKKIKCQERTNYIPVVMVTSLDSKSAKIVANADGADDFITKPIDKRELLARVKSLIKVKSLHDQLRNKDREIKELRSINEELVSMLDKAKAKAFRKEPDRS
jgi:PleD family two-component response regulator